MRKFTLDHYAAFALFFLTVSGFISCTHAPTQSALIETQKIDTIPVNDSIRARDRVVAFLQWYKANLNKANDWPFLGKDTNGYTIVDSVASANYLNYINSSGFVSSAYLATWRDYFVEKGVELKQNKIKEDVPDGFDFDLVLITQEPELVLNKIDSMQFKFIAFSDTAATIEMKLPSDDAIDYEFEMAKEKTEWRIVYISTPNYDQAFLWQKLNERLEYSESLRERENIANAEFKKPFQIVNFQHHLLRGLLHQE